MADVFLRVQLQPKSSRYDFIDSVRGLAVLLAIWDHAMVQFSGYLPTAILTRAATPTFLVLFGIMIEIVYRRKMRGDQGGGTPVRQIFMSRALTCYLLFCAISLAAVIGGNLTFPQAFRAVTYSGDGQFGNILRLYAVNFLIMTLIYPFLSRWGWRSVFLLSVLSWGLCLVLKSSGAPFNYFLHIIIGYGKGFGPAILLSLVFVAFGMMIGAFLLRQETLRIPALIFLLSFLIIALTVFVEGPLSFARNIATPVYRRENDIRYYAFGIVAASFFLLLFRHLEIRSALPWLRRFLSECGKQTLFIYGFGNIILSLLPLVHRGRFLGVVLMVFFIAILTMIAFDRKKKNSFIHRMTGGIFIVLASWYQRHLDVFMSSICRMNLRIRLRRM